MYFMFFAPQPQKEPRPQMFPTLEEQDEDLSLRMQAFDELGFEPWVSFVLAWRHVSPADVRERLLKRGATHDQVARIFL